VFIFIIYYKDIINIEWIKNLENWFLKVSFANVVSITNHMGQFCSNGPCGFGEDRNVKRLQMKMDKK
jgi:hypothetical protein